MKKFVGWIIGLLLIWGIVWYACMKHRDIRQELFSQDKPVVPVVKIVPETVVVTHEYLGRVIAIQSVSVLPYVSGFIEKVFISGGAQVTTGQMLFQLKQDQYLAAVAGAKAQLAEAQADMEKAKLYLRRIEQTSSEAISKTELDDARTNFLATQAMVSDAEARLKTAEINYNYTMIKSPIDGVVGNITATPGEYVGPQLSPLAYILQYDPIRVVFSMPDKDFLNLGADVTFFKTGQLKLKLSNGTILTTRGSVKFADNKIMADTSSIDLFADFANPDHQLLPGGFVRVLYDEKIPDAIQVDRALVNLHPEGDFVYVLKDGIISKTIVKTGAIIGSKVLIVSGLTAGELLIAEPIDSDQVGRAAVEDEMKASSP